MTHTIAIIGAGNMGLSLLQGLLHSHYPKEKIKATHPSPEKCAHLAKTFSIEVVTDNNTACQDAEIIILAVKPQILPAVLHEVKSSINARQSLIISLAAGVTLKSLEQGMGNPALPIIRSMPNTPALIGAGVTGLFANHHVTNDQKKKVESIFLTIGTYLWLEEEKWIDAVAALSGSGPAYFFLWMESLMQAGETLGLSPEIARALTLQTAYGAAKMARETKETVMALRKAVTSPEGTTEKAIQVMENASIRKIITDALLAAQHRSHELGILFQQKIEQL